MMPAPASNPTDDDCHLWDCLRGGDSQALETLFRRYYALLYDYGMKLCHQEDAVKDAIQDVFAYLWERRQTVSAVDCVRAYLLAATRRQLLKSLERQRRRQDIGQQFAADQPVQAFSPEDLVVMQEARDELFAEVSLAITRIPTRLREALYLKTYQGLTYQEVAIVMKVSPQVARNYVSRAFHRLRILLTERR
jgi:RNA polymerase sigma factor (sigma-70 family)